MLQHVQEEAQEKETQELATREYTDVAESLPTTQNSATSVAETNQASAVLTNLRRQARQRSLSYYALACALLLTMTVGVWTKHHHGYNAASSLITVLQILSLVLPLLWSIAAKRQEQRAEKVLASLDDLSLIGPLLETLAGDRASAQPSVSAALQRLLSRATRADVERLSPSQRASMHFLLSRRYSLRRKRYDRRVVLSLLKALEQIGTREDLSVVRRLAQWSSDSEIREAANGCLPFLLADAEAFRRSGTFLRPSSASEVGSDTLMRAAEATVSARPDELLRGSHDQSASE